MCKSIDATAEYRLLFNKDDITFFWWEMEKEGAQSLVTFAADFHMINNKNTSQVFFSITPPRFFSLLPFSTFALVPLVPLLPL